MNKLKFCPKCGTKLDPSERFCGECGYDIEKHDHADSGNPEHLRAEESHEAVHDTVPEPIPVSQQQDKKTGKSQQTAIIVLAVALGAIVIIGGLVFWWFSRGSALFNNAMSSETAQTKETQVTLGLPSYSLNEGSYTAEQKVVINKPDGEGIQVYFTIDGSEPTDQSSRYENPITLQSNTTLKSIAIDQNGNKSGIKTATYNITIQPPATSEAKLESTTATEASEESEWEKFGTYISGTWKITYAGRDYYYQFKNGILKIADAPEGTTDAGEYIEFTYSYDITPGNEGTVGIVYAEGTPLAIDCKPLGDNAIYINGYFATYSTSSFPFND
ncbi:chitobiase/beta-hexosaminidase C-terminal domain-containing protein [Acetobacterium fimetarium]|uniref:chitobiase/beta-hexosaminidase C-terminal domain-containing protein n=1 Tax=Acetobacterium fimetarium TaxID=52691 RepID=UPI00164B1D91|nr:chitobiase/beta-hexosaminidase C-terminal domain-containing protein [Acetobacterium fimetarium]